MGVQLNADALLVLAHTGAWDMAVKRVADAKTALERFKIDHLDPANRALIEGGGSVEQVSTAENAWFVYVMVHHDAIKALVKTKAPTLAALAFKIKTAHADAVFEGGYQDDAINAVLSDLSHLTGDTETAP